MQKLVLVDVEKVARWMADIHDEGGSGEQRTRDIQALCIAVMRLYYRSDAEVVEAFAAGVKALDDRSCLDIVAVARKISNERRGHG